MILTILYDQISRGKYRVTMLVTHLKSLVGNIADMTHAIFKIETNVKKIYFFSNANVLRDLT
jgi:hypothetical protein